MTITVDAKWKKREPLKDASSLYEVERRALYGQRPGFRISELQISPTRNVPWQLHNNIQLLRQGGHAASVKNDGDTSATFLILQSIGEYDYVPLV